jgi:DNA-binding transcriptional LysR family regulator
LSFKAAAEELLVTPSAVSHGIRSLEEWLGHPLFRRTPRGLVLTETGSAYYPAVRDALGALSAATMEIAARQSRQRLAISAAPTFAARWLLPRLPRFGERHPGIGVVIDTSKDHVDLESGGFDLAIRMGSGGWAGLFQEELVREHLVPVCAPSFLARAESMPTREWPIIRVSPARDEWDSWAETAGQAVPDRHRGLTVDTIEMAFAAASQGQGIAMGRRPLVDAELESGRLVEIRPPAVPSGTGYWLVGALRRERDPAIRAFRAWIMEESR